jgi:hypothetical protein
MDKFKDSAHEPTILPSFNKFLMIIADAKQQEDRENYQSSYRESPQGHLYESKYREGEPRVSHSEDGSSKYVGPVFNTRYIEPPETDRRFNAPAQILTKHLVDLGEISSPLFSSAGWDSPVLDRQSNADLQSIKAKPRRKTREQIIALKELYSLDRFPTRTDQFILSKQTDLSLKDIQLWFQNQRRNQKP